MMMRREATEDDVAHIKALAAARVRGASAHWSEETKQVVVTIPASAVQWKVDDLHGELSGKYFGFSFP